MERKGNEKAKVLVRDTSKKVMEKGTVNTSQKDMGKEKDIKVLGKEEKEKTDLEWGQMGDRYSMGYATIVERRDIQKQVVKNWDWD